MQISVKLGFLWQVPQPASARGKNPPNTSRDFELPDVVVISGVWKLGSSGVSILETFSRKGYNMDKSFTTLAVGKISFKTGFKN